MPRVPESANKCNEYFTTIGAKLTNDILEKQNETEINLANLAKSHIKPSHFFFMLPTDETEILDYIRQLKNDSAPGLDGHKNTLIKHLAPYILKPFAHICNLSLSTGIFPKIWKMAAVTPIHKAGNKENPSNYRPFYLLSVLSKLLELTLDL